MLSASSPAQSAMRGGGGLWQILAWTCLLLASALYMVDPLELSSYSVAPISLLAADYAGVSSAENEVHAKTTHYDASAANDDQSDLLFGLETEPVTNGPLLEKWRRVQAIITKDLELIDQCQTAKTCPFAAQKLIDLSSQGSRRSGRGRIGVINRAVNLAIRPVSDETQWGDPDHWSEPLETLHSNSGDCEDYAIVKYAALLVAGISKDAVKIVVLKNRLPNEDHAVVAVRVDRQWLILDNRTMTLVRDTDVTRAIPKFALDDHGVARFVWTDLNRKAESYFEPSERRSRFAG